MSAISDTSLMWIYRDLVEEIKFLELLSDAEFLFTVPTTCSRSSIEMVAFIYLFMYVCISPCSLPGQTVIYYLPKFGM